jgi:hypothetical protein
MVPEFIFSRVIKARNTVDFPEPLGPIIASFSAGATARLRSFNTRRSPKYLST